MSPPPPLLFWVCVACSKSVCERERENGAENKFILQIEQISEKIIRLKQIDSIHFYVILKALFYGIVFRRQQHCIPSWDSELTFEVQLKMELITITNPFSPLLTLSG